MIPAPVVDTKVTTKTDVREINSNAVIPTKLADQSEEVTTYTKVVTETPPEMMTVHKDVIETTTHIPAAPPKETTTTVKKEIVNTNVELPAPPPVVDVVKNVDVRPVQVSSYVERIDHPSHTTVQREVVSNVHEASRSAISTEQMRNYPTNVVTQPLPPQSRALPPGQVYQQPG